MTEQTRAEMKKILKEIQDGTYARNWINENKIGRKWFNAKRREEQDALIERVGAELRAMMPFIKPVRVTPESEQAAVGAK